LRYASEYKVQLGGKYSAPATKRMKRLEDEEEHIDE
jgi:hypothetical protein